MSEYGDMLKQDSAQMKRDLTKAYEDAKKALEEAKQKFAAAQQQLQAASQAYDQIVVFGGGGAALAAAADAVAVAATGMTAASAAVAAATAVLEAAAAALAAIAAWYVGRFAGQGIGLGLDWIYDHAKKIKWSKFVPKWLGSARVLPPPATYAVARQATDQILTLIDAYYSPRPEKRETGSKDSLALISPSVVVTYERSEVARALYDVAVANVQTFIHLAQAMAYAHYGDPRANEFAETIIPSDLGHQLAAYHRAIEVLSLKPLPFDEHALTLAGYNDFVRSVKTHGETALPIGEGAVLRLALSAAGFAAAADFEMEIVQWLAAPDKDEARTVIEATPSDSLGVLDALVAESRLWQNLQGLDWKPLRTKPRG
jgi:hypothetical protein